jgi:hypothetical protein
MQTTFSSEAENRRSNPYAPPQSESGPTADSTAIDEALNQRRIHLRRESCIRMTGLLSFMLNAIVVVALGLLAYFALRPFPSPIPRSWIAFATLVAAIAFACAVTGWGLYLLRNWARWGLTLLAALPPASQILCWILINYASDPPWDRVPGPGRLERTIGLSLLSSLPQLIVMWSPKSSVVFSSAYKVIIRQTRALPRGWLGILPAMLLAPAALLSSFLLMMSVILAMAMFGMVPTD